VLALGDEERVLQVGEWSDWVTVAFELIPTQTLHAVARFYLKSVDPDFEMYVSPLNIDPESPALPISTPGGYAAELARATGDFYTQGMPEDTKALTEGVLTREEFLAQARIAGEENLAQYKYVLGQFDEGLLFYYFGNPDQISHMMWRPMDPGHPAYDPAVDARFEDVIPDIYETLDEVVGYTLARIGEDDTLIVMSDHGFTSWRRAFHLNTWLRENGYLAVKDPDLEKDPGLFANVDWPRTRAYGLGLNGLYINLSGRERFGIVPPETRAGLMEEIAERLLRAVDPGTGKRAVTKVYRREEAFRDRGELEIGPDMVVGYAKGMRGSNESALGEIGPKVVTDNTSVWSGDHCMDHETVPGILLTNRPLKRPVSELKDLAAGILAEFGIEGFPSPDQIHASATR
jgi:predicted AlkP superfamily phosphohydrolase/phosphomutase